MRGPPPGVGGRPPAELTGDSGGDSRGAGILVPAVREYSTGLTESGMYELRFAPWVVVVVILGDVLDVCNSVMQSVVAMGILVR